MNTLKTAQIVFEDEWILAVDKRSNVVVNRSGTTKEKTLQDDLAGYFGLAQDDLGIGDRAGIVHRLDRGTSGLLIVAKTQKVFENLQAQFKARQVAKVYLALVHGHIKDQSGTIEAKIERIGKFGKFGISNRRSLVGREARTEFEVVGRYTMPEDNLSRFLQGRTLSKARVNYLKNHARDYTLLRIFPRTGRTHQVRVHLKSIGHPVVSDLIYTPAKLLKFDLLWCPRLFLHASSLAFSHPVTKKQVKFESDLPKDLKNAILNLDKI